MYVLALQIYLKDYATQRKQGFDVFIEAVVPDT